MKLIEITPKSFSCGIGACPAIFETTDGNYILIGRKLPQRVAEQKLAGRIGPDEIAVEIPGELLANLASKKV